MWVFLLEAAPGAVVGWRFHRDAGEPSLLAVIEAGPGRWEEAVRVARHTCEIGTGGMAGQY